MKKKYVCAFYFSVTMWKYYEKLQKNVSGTLHFNYVLLLCYHVTSESDKRVRKFIRVGFLVCLRNLWGFMSYGGVFLHKIDVSHKSLNLSSISCYKKGVLHPV